MKIDGALFRYSGAKHSIAASQAVFFPPHKLFCCPFAGSVAEFRYKEPSRLEIFNDLDDLVANVFFVLQNEQQRRQLIKLTRASFDGRKQYFRCRKILEETNDPVQRAWSFLICANVGHVSHPLCANGWKTYKDYSRHELIRLPRKIVQWVRRMRKVKIECRPWQDVLNDYDAEDTFHYLDPPYLPSVIRGNPRGLYQHSLSEADHVELLERINNLKGYVLICGYPNEIYDSYLFHWRAKSLSTRERMSSVKGKRTEVIWTNYEPDGTKIKDHKALITRRFVKAMGGDAEAAAEWLETYKYATELNSKRNGKH